MELKKFNIDGRDVEFVNSYRNTRSGFAHDTTLFINNRNYGAATCIYYNRTWESYCYQSVMQKVVYQILEEHIEYLKDKFKTDHGYIKFTPKRTEEFEQVTGADPEVKFYNKLLETLRKW